MLQIVMEGNVSILLGSKYILYFVAVGLSIQIAKLRQQHKKLKDKMR